MFKGIANLAHLVRQAQQVSGKMQTLNEKLRSERAKASTGGGMVEVEEWHPHLGGSSWWFHCPACNRRCLKLYRPPGAYWFYCRRCHGLAYISSQEAHRWDRGAMIGMLCAMTGASPREYEKEMRADFKAQREAARR